MNELIQTLSLYSLNVKKVYTTDLEIKSTWYGRLWASITGKLDKTAIASRISDAFNRTDFSQTNKHQLNTLKTNVDAFAKKFYKDGSTDAQRSSWETLDAVSKKVQGLIEGRQHQAIAATPSQTRFKVASTVVAPVANSSPPTSPTGKATAPKPAFPAEAPTSLSPKKPDAKASGSRFVRDPRQEALVTAISRDTAEKKGTQETRTTLEISQQKTLDVFNQNKHLVASHSGFGTKNIPVVHTDSSGFTIVRARRARHQEITAGTDDILGKRDIGARLREQRASLLRRE